MASLRRSKVFNPDPQTKFLYVIIKQLDLRSIDWQAVANEIGINNGHAARMRYSRLKSQFEGPSLKHRDPKSRDDRKVSSALKMKAKGSLKPGYEPKMKDPFADDDSSDDSGTELIIKKEKMMMGFDNVPLIKTEPGTTIKVEDFEKFRSAPFVQQESSPRPSFSAPFVKQEPAANTSFLAPFVKQEPAPNPSFVRQQHESPFQRIMRTPTPPPGFTSMTVVNPMSLTNVPQYHPMSAPLAPPLPPSLPHGSRPMTPTLFNNGTYGINSMTPTSLQKNITGYYRPHLHLQASSSQPEPNFQMQSHQAVIAEPPPAFDFSDLDLDLDIKAEPSDLDTIILDEN